VALVQAQGRRLETPYAIKTSGTKEKETNLLLPDPEPLSQRDLARAKKVVPGPAFQAAHAGVSNELLNKHLRRLTSGKAVPCEDLSTDQVATTVRELRALSHPGLAKIYAANVHPILKDNWKDPRGIEGAYVSERALQELPEQHVQEAMKEKACYDAAMAFTHSLPDTDKSHFLQRIDVKIPLLPTRSAEETRTFLEMGMPTSPSPSLAANHHRRLGDVGEGENIFNANCAACHAGGQNVIMAEKTLEVCAPGAGLALPQSRLLPSPRRAVCAPPLAEGGDGAAPVRRLQREVRGDAGALRPPHPTHPMARRSAHLPLGASLTAVTADSASFLHLLLALPTPLARR